MMLPENERNNMPGYHGKKGKRPKPKGGKK